MNPIYPQELRPSPANSMVKTMPKPASFEGIGKSQVLRGVSRVNCFQPFGETVTHLHTHTLDSAPTDIRPILERLAKRTGTLINIHATMADSPIVLAAYAGLVDAIAKHGSLDARTKEAIALTVGAANGCDYCQAAHTVAAKMAGLSESETISIRLNAVTFDDKLASLLSVVRDAAENVGTVEDTTWQFALDSGWSEQELSETFAHLMANVFTNYFNHFANTELDFPAAPSLTTD